MSISSDTKLYLIAGFRFWAKVEETKTCWLWLGTINQKGYGSFRFQGKLFKAHRAAYLFEKGSLPKGMEIDHICKVRNCVNPAHLEAVTRRENVLRSDCPSAVFARRDLCSRGHKLEKHPRRAGRICLPCTNLSGRERRKRIGDEVRAYHRAYYAKNKP